ncbi:MAG TPA: VanZ family protein [Anaerolineales bacterium]|nr:VanZ family protein [Anaerolineales bacterium]
MRSAYRWIPALAMMGAIFFFSSLPAEVLPFFGKWDFLVKKGGHLTGYAMLGVSYFYALPPRLSTSYRALMALLMAVLFAASDEFHQSFVEGRTSTLRDVLIDALGSTLALLGAVIYSSNSNSSRRSAS